MKFYAFLDSDERAANTEKHSPLENGSVSVSVSASVRLDTSRLSRVALVWVRAVCWYWCVWWCECESHSLRERESARPGAEEEATDEGLSTLRQGRLQFFLENDQKDFPISQFIIFSRFMCNASRHNKTSFPPIGRAHARRTSARINDDDDLMNFTKCPRKKKKQPMIIHPEKKKSCERRDEVHTYLARSVGKREKEFFSSSSHFRISFFFTCKKLNFNSFS